MVSISDEKPLHMRHPLAWITAELFPMFQSQMRSRSTCDACNEWQPGKRKNVSISDEKPLHMRHSDEEKVLHVSLVSISGEKPLHMRQVEKVLNVRYQFRQFQSQMRSRSTCDKFRTVVAGHQYTVSISDEKPLHMRPNRPESDEMA